MVIEEVVGNFATVIRAGVAIEFRKFAELGLAGDGGDPLNDLGTYGGIDGVGHHPEADGDHIKEDEEGEGEDTEGEDDFDQAEGLGRGGAG